MPRPLRQLIPGYPVHVLQRGHNRERCFAADEDYVLYLALLQEASHRFGCMVHAYVLMTNHYHLLVTPSDAVGLSRMMQRVNQIYAQYVNRRQHRCGTLWQGRPTTCLVDSDRYFLTCQRYIELNPVRANMIDAPWLYPWSSYLINAGGRASELVRPHPTYIQLGKTPQARHAAYRELFRQELDAETLGKIRAAVNHLCR